MAFYKNQWPVKSFYLSLFWPKCFAKPVITASGVQVEIKNKAILIQAVEWKPGVDWPYKF